jgi:hypothetical protein
MDAAKPHTKAANSQKIRISSDEREKATGFESTSSEPHESERRPTGFAPFPRRHHLPMSKEISASQSEILAFGEDIHGSS